MSMLTEDLARILATVNRPGDFYASGLTELLQPRLEVEGVGPIALPLLPVQAEQLVAAAERAPFGRGTETVLDVGVRRTWQIDADRLRIGGKHWQRTLDDIVARAAAGLGVSEPVSAELYKLLVYDEGSFFVSHRDTEKTPGMFATLVLALPSRSEGGELVVRHKGREARLALKCEEPSETAFAAFYADCVHEVLPVTSGCRLTLIYNLARKGRGARPEPPSYEGETAKVTALLQRWADDEAAPSGDAPIKLIYPLEHAYTQAELDFRTLKGADAAVAGVLTAAAPQAGCDLHLALLSIEESGAAEYVGGGRWKEPELEAGEVFDRHETLSEWRRPDGHSSSFRALPIKDGELSPPDALEDLEPDEEEFQEATGNAGASFDRIYRRAALVLWPSARIIAVLNQAGLSATLPYLEELIGRWKSGGADPNSPIRLEARDLAGHMLATWPAEKWYPRHDSGPTNMGRMLKLLARLEDKDAADRLIETLIAQGGHHGGDNTAILQALALFPPDRATDYLRRIVAAGAVATLGACGGLLAGAVRGRFASRPAQLMGAVNALVDAMPGDPSLAPKDQFGRPRGASPEAGFVADLVGVVDAVDDVLARRAASHMLAWPRHYGLDNILVPALQRPIEAGKAGGGTALELLRAACLAHLTSRAAEALEAPKDWSRPNDIACKCGHCAALGRFLADPERPVWNLKAAQQVRDHVDNTIRGARSDIDTRTERRGSPHILVCTKNRASYERRVVQRKQDLTHIKMLGGAAQVPHAASRRRARR